MNRYSCTGREACKQRKKGFCLSLVGSSHRNLMKVTATTNNEKMNFKKDTKGAQLSDDREGCNGGMVGGRLMREGI